MDLRCTVSSNSWQETIVYDDSSLNPQWVEPWDRIFKYQTYIQSNVDGILCSCSHFMEAGIAVGWQASLNGSFLNWRIYQQINCFRTRIQQSAARYGWRYDRLYDRPTFPWFQWAKLCQSLKMSYRGDYSSELTRLVSSSERKSEWWPVVSFKQLNPNRITGKPWKLHHLFIQC